MIDQLTIPQPENKKAYFVRIPADMYEAIQEVAQTQGRTIQMQTQILIGAALNRNLVNPSGETKIVTSNDK